MLNPIIGLNPVAPLHVCACEQMLSLWLRPSGPRIPPISPTAPRLRAKRPSPPCPRLSSLRQTTTSGGRWELICSTWAPDHLSTMRALLESSWMRFGPAGRGSYDWVTGSPSPQEKQVCGELGNHWSGEWFVSVGSELLCIDPPPSFLRQRRIIVCLSLSDWLQFLFMNFSRDWLCFRLFGCVQAKHWWDFLYLNWKQPCVNFFFFLRFSEKTDCCSAQDCWTSGAGGDVTAPLLVPCLQNCWLLLLVSVNNT